MVGGAVADAFVVLPAFHLTATAPVSLPETRLLEDFADRRPFAEPMPDGRKADGLCLHTPSAVVDDQPQKVELQKGLIGMQRILNNVRDGGILQSQR